MAQWLDPKAPTLARSLQKAGYATGHFGKWHMGGQRNVADAPAITAYGFDRVPDQFRGHGSQTSRNFLSLSNRVRIPRNREGFGRTPPALVMGFVGCN